jgi:hypothetical protein
VILMAAASATALIQRRAQLAMSVVFNDTLRLSVDLPGTAAEVLEAVRAAGLEGVVAKRRNSTYQAGELREGCHLSYPELFSRMPQYVWIGSSESAPPLRPLPAVIASATGAGPGSNAIHGTTSSPMRPGLARCH